MTFTGGDGNNDVDVAEAQNGDTFTINLGNGESTAVVEGTALAQTAKVTVNGGSGVDTLLFDAKGGPIDAYTSAGALIADDQPATPNGQIQAAGGPPIPS